MSRHGSPRKANSPRSSATFRLDDWLPYQFAFTANYISLALFDFYNRHYGMSLVAWRVMVRVGSDGPLSGREVGRLATMDAVQVTRAINELAELGLINRRIDPDDRRRIVLRLSAKGEAAYEKIVPKAIELEKWLLAELTPSELKILRSVSARLLKKICEAV